MRFIVTFRRVEPIPCHLAVLIERPSDFINQNPFSIHQLSISVNQMALSIDQTPRGIH